MLVARSVNLGVVTNVVDSIGMRQQDCVFSIPMWIFASILALFSEIRQIALVDIGHACSK